MSVDLSVVVLTYRCRDEALECLSSIVEGTHEATYELIVVDNASGDDTLDVVGRAHPDARLIQMDENVGFARGVNRGAEEASGDFVLLVNPDAVVHDGSFDRLVAFARSAPAHGLYGGRAFYPDGRLQPGSCWGKPSLWSLFCFATMLSTAFKGSAVFDPESLGGWQRDTVREVDVVTGCLLLVERDVWQRLGGMDDRYFMYGEDADFSLRAAALGYRPVVTPDAVITHEVGVSSASRPDKVILLLRGKVTLIRRHWSPMRSRIGAALLLGGVGVRALVGAVPRPGRRSGSGPGSPWPTAWRARGTWLQGYGSPERSPSRALVTTDRPSA